MILLTKNNFISAKETKIMINPRGVKIVANTVGFFIANDAEEVRRANAFCKVTPSIQYCKQLLLFISRKLSFLTQGFMHRILKFKYDVQKFWQIIF